MLKNSVNIQYTSTLTLLCVEYSDTVQSYYHTLFTSMFKKIFFATDGVEALKLYPKADILIIAHQTQQLNGIEIIRFIREKDSIKPIILVTNNEDLTLFTSALHLHVNALLKRSFEQSEILDAIQRAIELVLAYKSLAYEQETEIIALQKKEEYRTYQEDLSFKKELSMIRNDFYYRLAHQDSSEKFHLCDFSYKPLDTMSGDLYSARQLTYKQELYILIDGMGKGISASVSAILAISFINYIVDRTLFHKRMLDIERLNEALLYYMRNHLLEDEVLAVSLVIVDADNLYVEYASFGMPNILLMDRENKVHHLHSNNPPLSPYSYKAKSNKIALKNMVKMLIASDGIFENSVKDKNESYAEYIEEDFIASVTSFDFLQRMQKKIASQEDDMTLIFLHQLQLNQHIVSKEIVSNLANIDTLNLWYEEQFNRLSSNPLHVNKACIAFNELLMNAYEHGIFRLSNREKHQRIEDDTYISYLQEQEKIIHQQIKVSLYKINNSVGEHFIISKIEDSGEGFDTEIFSKIFGFQTSFNDRGVFMAKKSSIGIYYNNSGNSVFYINPI